MPQTMQHLIDKYVSALRKIYGDHIQQIILYGSYARGDFTKDSDVDIMILVDLPEDQIDRYADYVSEVGFDYNVDYDVWFMPIVKNIDHFKYWSQVYPFYSNIEKEGVTLYRAA